MRKQKFRSWVLQQKRKKKWRLAICDICRVHLQNGDIKKGSKGKILFRGMELCEKHFQLMVGNKKYKPPTPNKLKEPIKNYYGEIINDSYK